MMERRRLAIIGDGKMGVAIRDLAAGAGFDVIAFLGEADVAATGPTAAQLADAQVAIEFTIPTAAAANVVACANAGVPVVCGTTGWESARPSAEIAVHDAGGALLWSPNFSIGVQLFSRIVARAAAELKAVPGMFDAHLIETHHSEKKDAPSGTAKLLADRATASLGIDIPITSVRTGTVPGTHEFVFDAAFEQITLTHMARDRRVFAAGALSAARWIVGKKGVFTMDDLLGTI